MISENLGSLFNVGYMSVVYLTLWLGSVASSHRWRVVEKERMGSHNDPMHWMGFNRGTEGFLAWRNARARTLGAELDIVDVTVRQATARRVKESRAEAATEKGSSHHFNLQLSFETGSVLMRRIDGEISEVEKPLGPMIHDT